MRFITCLLAILFLTTPANAKLLFKGTKDHKKGLKSWYLRMPEKGKNTVFDLQEVPQAKIDELMEDTGYAGAYNWHIQKAYISKNLPEFYEVFVHEYGHHYYQVALTQAQKEEWHKFWSENKEKMPRKYGQTDEFEGWAVVWEHYFYRDPMTLNPAVLGEFQALL